MDMCADDVEISLDASQCGADDLGVELCPSDGVDTGHASQCIDDGEQGGSVQTPNCDK